jgi:hypothetical protein
MKLPRSLGRIALATVASVALAGCGSTPDASGPTPAPSPSAATLPKELATALAQRLDAQNGTLGRPVGTIELDTPAGFGRLAGKAGQAAVQLGLEGEAIQHIDADTDGIRRVMRFGTPQQAAAYLRIEEKPVRKGVSVHSFKVPGVPGVVAGEQLPGPSASGMIHSRNVAFVIGRYEYYLGVAVQPGATKPGNKDLALGAKAWYDALVKLG